MINDGQVYLAGYVASSPSFKITGGKPQATVRVAFTPRWMSRETGEWADGPTSFVNVLCWRALAGNVAVSLRKGEPVLVMGRLRVRRYQDKEGMPRIAVEVEANSIGHDLTRGVAAFSRTRRALAETAVEAAEALLAAGTGAEGGSADQEGPGDVAGEDRAGDGRAGDEGAGDDGARGGGARGGGTGDDWAGGGGAGSDGTRDGASVASPDGELDDDAAARLAHELGGTLSEVGVPL